ncbi:MAG: hypothetical protein PVH61_31675 [Candidatus Aminicenantes bacterium]|jgi:hypothetical protein
MSESLRKTDLKIVIISSLAVITIFATLFFFHQNLIEKKKQKAEFEATHYKEWHTETELIINKHIEETTTFIPTGNGVIIPLQNTEYYLTLNETGTRNVSSGSYSLYEVNDTYSYSWYIWREKE